MSIVLTYLVVVNAIGFVLMSYDKSQSKHSGQRVPEKRLFMFAAIGGALGSWLGMRIFRHKTKHMTFVEGMPVLIVINIVCFYYIKSFIHS